MDFFKRDIVLLLLVSILLGTAVSRAVSYGADLYFKETLISLVGDYGEYDLIVQIREENKENGKVQLEKILAENLVGATYKEGPAIVQKVNFFIALPSEYKNKAVYESLDKIFSSIPGGAGISIITEPKLDIRGVPTGAVEMMIEQLQAIPGVDFVYRSGSSIGVVLAGNEHIASVTSQVEAVLGTNKMLEISFPAGMEPENPVLLAETIVTNLYKKLQLRMAKYVSVDNSNDDIAHMTSTMQEMRKFLKVYQTQLYIKPENHITLAKDYKLVLQGEDMGELQVGELVQKKHIIVSLTGANANGSFTGVITQGDVQNIKDTRAYLVDQDRVAAYAGNVTWSNPREEMLYALSETEKLTSELPRFAKESNTVSKLALDTLNFYDENAANVEKTLGNMDNAVNIINRANEKIESIDVPAIQAKLNSSAKSMTGLIGTLKLVRLVNPDVKQTIGALEETQDKMTDFSDLLSGIYNVNEEAVQAKNILSMMTDNGNRINHSLQLLNQGNTKDNLVNANKRLNQLANSDFTSVSEALGTLQASAPKLNDEEIYSSIGLMDKMINGQVIPNKRLQIMIDHTVWIENVKPIIYETIGHQNVGIFESNIGVIEPNVYLQAYQILNEVQSVLAGVTAFVMTIILLALDHTAVMSALRNQRLRKMLYKQPSGFLPYSKQLLRSIFYIENVYGMLVGAGMLSFIFYFSGAQIPYVNWYIIPFIGAAFGFLMALITEKITPLSLDEVLAGESLGMTFTEIMHEIIIPNSRPGVLERLNKRILKFK